MLLLLISANINNIGRPSCKQQKTEQSIDPTDIFICPFVNLPCKIGQVDQLEDRYLGMVEASGSNPDLSTFGVLDEHFAPEGFFAMLIDAG